MNFEFRPHHYEYLLIFDFIFPYIIIYSPLTRDKIAMLVVAMLLLFSAHSLNHVTPLSIFRTSSLTSRAGSVVRLSSFATTDSSSSAAADSVPAAAAISTTITTKPIPIEDAYEKVSMDDIVSLCKRRGFIFPSSEIYNGFAGFYDYGPLGAELKKNVKDAWWKTFVTRRDDVVGIDSSIIHNPTTWKSSGKVFAVYLLLELPCFSWCLFLDLSPLHLS